MNTCVHIVSSIIGDSIDSCTFGTFEGTNCVPGKDRNQLQQYLGVPMRCGMDPAILSGVTVHASSSENVWRGKPTWKSSQFPFSRSRDMVGVWVSWNNTYMYLVGIIRLRVPAPELCEVFSPRQTMCGHL